MKSKEYWDKKIIEWEDSISNIENSGNKVTNSPEFSKGQFFKTSDAINRIVHNRRVSFIESLASKFRKPLRVRSGMCLELLKRVGKNKSILELGCGSGFFAFQVYKEVKANKIIGIDISPNAISRANNIKKELKLKDKIKFLESDASLIDLPKADITVGLGFLDYLNSEEIKELFNNIKSKHFLFTFSERKFSILRFFHIIYLILQRCPKHYYYTKKEIFQFANQKYKNIKIISHPRLSFGCIVHNLDL